MFAQQRVALLQVWKSFEEQHGMAEDIAKVEGMMPVQGKRRYVDEETGQLVEGMCSDSRRLIEHLSTCDATDYDYIFADDEREANPTSFKFLQMAHAWAASRKAGSAGDAAGNGGGGGGGALSRFAAARAQDDPDKDSRTESDRGENESMDEDVASVASSQGGS
jgi:crooked neck